MILIEQHDDDADAGINDDDTDNADDDAGSTDANDNNSDDDAGNTDGNVDNTVDANFPGGVSALTVTNTREVN